MARSEIWKDKLVLAVDDEEDVLETIRDLLPESEMTLHTATTFEKARELLASHSYDLVVLDIMGVRGFDLLKIASIHKLPAVMLTAHAVNPEALKKSIELGARAYLPKDMIYSLVPFLEDVMKLSYQSVWNKALDHVGTLFNEKFGSDWRKSEEAFWDDFQKTLSLEEGVIIK
ncbi:MAG: response regulator [Desulfomonile tiedjei]|uniref:Response regulator n=1 Tax=Desulfomonile tiedjei TaxID=2358 RepID=A0A9D6UXN6_9BACT|nr:response regulator [Desulfomonile tiedjei]